MCSSCIQMVVTWRERSLVPLILVPITRFCLQKFVYDTNCFCVQKWTSHNYCCVLRAWSFSIPVGLSWLYPSERGLHHSANLPIRVVSNPSLKPFSRTMPKRAWNHDLGGGTRVWPKLRVGYGLQVAIPHDTTLRIVLDRTYSKMNTFSSRVPVYIAFANLPYLSIGAKRE